ncbi:hypothetical protein SH661x_002416 [Planctomicrobium sp. SH661]|uniref:hypothetical protein n=1 Tax=Planctomicrobium sp. SH661 TaxID=3448124 RepID=UPI003F5C3164
MASSLIRKDGTFAVNDLKPGLARIAVVVSLPPASSPPRNDPKDPVAPKVAELTFKPVVVPEKFSRVETSGVSVKLDPSIRDYKIDLK